MSPQCHTGRTVIDWTRISILYVSFHQLFENYIMDTCNDSQIVLPPLFWGRDDNNKVALSLIEIDWILYVSLACYWVYGWIAVKSTVRAYACNVTLLWSNSKTICSPVRNHVCVYSDYNDIKKLLERDHVWWGGAPDHGSLMITHLQGCRSTSLLHASKKV